ncbi:AAA family ATPase [Methanoculleus sp.]|uniref:AAA family ATPase n=1 Tax=Methanoculleus sp. TaxID=90427 RepID=UPI0025D39496|nr:AAA family ATPase [Methanoculleus sp.]MCK9320080.1 AAA family ATPase [Methanoculleus sp.]
MLFETERPSTLKQIVGRDKEIKQIQDMIARPDGIPHILLSGKAGTGKTTAAIAIANEILGDNKKSNFFEFNASSTRGIDFIRNEIGGEIAKRRPLGGAPYKIILLDEADNITADAQMCLRRIMELHGRTTKFILTANYPFKLVAPLLSRCVQIPFDAIDTKTIAMHLKRIAAKHKMVFTDQQLIQFAKMANGDMRLAINNLEGNVSSSSSEFIDKLTIASINGMERDAKISIAFSADPDYIFGKLWEIVQKEKAWDKLVPMADCNHKMNNAVHKTLFLANLLESHF